MGHPNEDLIRRGYDAFSGGDMDTLRELFHPDIIWHAPGRGQLAGDHQGVDAVLGYFGRTMEMTGGNFGVEVRDGKVTEVWQYLADQYAADDLFG
jgi:ketosteroid isomerase-like protein